MSFVVLDHSADLTAMPDHAADASMFGVLATAPEPGACHASAVLPPCPPVRCQQTPPLPPVASAAPRDLATLRAMLAAQLPGAASSDAAAPAAPGGGVPSGKEPGAPAAAAPAAACALRALHPDWCDGESSFTLQPRGASLLTTCGGSFVGASRGGSFAGFQYSALSAPGLPATKGGDSPHTAAVAASAGATQSQRRAARLSIVDALKAALTACIMPHTLALGSGGPAGGGASAGGSAPGGRQEVVWVGAGMPFMPPVAIVRAA